MKTIFKAMAGFVTVATYQLGSPSAFAQSLSALPDSEPPVRLEAGAELTEPKDAVRENDASVLERSFSGKITAISRDEQMVTVEDRAMGSQRLRIGESSKLKRGNRTASWEDLEVGTTVSGVTRGAPGEAHVDWLQIGG